MTTSFRTLLAVLILLYTTDVSAAVVATSRDTYIHSVNVNTNYGQAETIAVNAQSTALVWHDIDTVLPAGTTAEQVVKATLQLWVSASSPSVRGMLRVVPIQQTWGQGQVVYATRPYYATTSLTTVAFNGGRSFYLVVDVTEIVRNWVKLRGSNNGVAILAADNSASLLFDSRKNSTTSHPALLDITLLNPSTMLTGKTFAVCAQSRYEWSARTQETCNCSKTQVYKFSSSKSGAKCNAPAELNSCSEAISSVIANDTYVISCCVCAPF